MVIRVYNDHDSDSNVKVCIPYSTQDAASDEIDLTFCLSEVWNVSIQF